MKKVKDKEKFEIKEDKEEQENYLSMGISLGLCFGSSIGLIFGMLMDDITLGLCFGPGIGMCLGILISSSMKKTKKNKDESKK